MPATPRDPFSLVYEGLWNLVERNQALKTFISQGNRIKYEEEQDQKINRSDADVPELSLFSTGGTFGTLDDSTNRSCTRFYDWMLLTGSYRVIDPYTRVAFEIWRSMCDWQCVLCPLTWCSCTFVKDLRLSDLREGLSVSQATQSGLEGWAGIWRIEVDFALPLSKLKLTNNPLI